MKLNVRPSGSRASIAGHALGRRTADRRQSRRTVVLVRAEENIFQKLGTQLTKAGTQLSGTIGSTLGGTRRLGKNEKRDEDTIFVAGATGRLGARIVKECLLKGYKVRAGARSLEKGEKLIATAQEYGVLTPEEIARIQLVEYDLFDEDTIAPAIGNAGRVVCAIGAAEDKPFDTKAPQKVDGEAAISLIKCSAGLNVSQFIMVTSLGTTKFGWPASVLNLFWGVLYWKKQAEEALQKSGMPYTIVRPGGMEKPTDSFKDTHNVVLTERDQLFGGQVSRLQVAEVIATCLSSRELAENKVLEVIADTEAPAEDYETLLEGVTQEISVAEVNEKRAEIADARNQASLIESDVDELEARLVEAEERKIRAQEAFQEARSDLQEVNSVAGAALQTAESMQSSMDNLTAQLESSRREEAAAKAVLDAQRRLQRTLEILDARAVQEIVEPILNGSGASAQSSAKSSNPFAMFGLGAKPAQAVEEVEEEIEEEVVKPAKRGFSLFGKKAEAVVEEIEEEIEEVDVEEEVVKPAKRGFSLFGKKAKAVAEEVVEEVEEAVEEVDVEEEVVKPAKRGFSFFGQKAKAVAEDVEEAVEEVDVQEEVVKPAKRAGAQLSSKAKAAAEQVQEQVEEAVEEVQEAAPQATSKGGGFFGMFQQETVQAEEQPGAFGSNGTSSSSAPDSIPTPPSPEEISRAVTKRGRGPPPNRKSIRELNPKKSAQAVKDEVVEVAEEVAEVTKEAAKEVKAGAKDAAKEIKAGAKEVKAGAKDVAQEVQSATKEAVTEVKKSGMFDNFFNNAKQQLDQAVDKVSEQAEAAKPIAEDVVSDVKAAAKDAEPAVKGAAKDLKAAAQAAAKDAEPVVKGAVKDLKAAAKEAEPVVKGAVKDLKAAAKEAEPVVKGAVKDLKAAAKDAEPAVKGAVKDLKAVAKTGAAQVAEKAESAGGGNVQKEAEKVSDEVAANVSEAEQWIGKYKSKLKQKVNA